MPFLLRRLSEQGATGCDDLARWPAISMGCAPSKGLRVQVTHKPLKGGAKARGGDRVAVHYTGKLQDGSTFDSSLDRKEPFSFVLGNGQVIRGWEQGIRGMCVGEKRTLTVPPDLAYGAAGRPPMIPPHSTLVFTTELVSLNGKAAGA